MCGEGIPWHPTSIATGAQLTREELRLLTFYDLATTVCAMSSHHWPCNTSWEHSMSHNIDYMSHTIDKWNLYCSYTIKYIFVSIGIPRDLTALKKKKKKKKFAPQRHFFSGMLTRTKNVNLFGLTWSNRKNECAYIVRAARISQKAYTYAWQHVRTIMLEVSVKKARKVVHVITLFWNMTHYAII